jgi:hypothetical protein
LFVTALNGLFQLGIENKLLNFLDFLSPDIKMKIHLFSIFLSLLGLSLCSELKDSSSDDDSESIYQDSKTETSHFEEIITIMRHSNSRLNYPSFDKSGNSSREKYTQIMNEILSPSGHSNSSNESSVEESHDISQEKFMQTYNALLSHIPSHEKTHERPHPPLFTFPLQSKSFHYQLDESKATKEARDDLIRSFRESFREMKSIYSVPYFTICQDQEINEKFLRHNGVFNLRIKLLFDNLKYQIRVLNSLFDTFDKNDNFWIFFWITHCRNNFKSDFAAYQTLLFRMVKFSPQFIDDTRQVLGRIVPKIDSYIQELNKLNDISSPILKLAKSGLESQLQRFTEYQKEFSPSK